MMDFKCIGIINNIVCNEEFQKYKNETWRKYCPDCYRNNLIDVVCENHECEVYFKRLSHETWRKNCSDCYRKNQRK
jgi:hypothetical protein